MNRRSFIRQVALGVPAMLALPAFGWPKEPQSKAAEEVIKVPAALVKRPLWNVDGMLVTLPNDIEPLDICGTRVFAAYGPGGGICSSKLAVLVRYYDYPLLQGHSLGRSFLNSFTIHHHPSGAKWAVVEWSLNTQYEFSQINVDGGTLPDGPFAKRLLEEAGKALAAA